eukprot:361084-Hanusia_phi.AAC.2
MDHACDLWLELQKHYGQEIAMNIAEPLVLHLCGAGKISMAMDFIEEHGLSVTFECFRTAVNAIVSNLMKECPSCEPNHPELVEKRIACEKIRIWIDHAASSQGLNYQILAFAIEAYSCIPFSTSAAEEIIRCYEDLRRTVYEPSTKLYEIVIESAALILRDIEVTNQILSEVLENGIDHTTRMKSSLCCAYAFNGEIEQATSILASIDRKDVMTVDTCIEALCHAHIKAGDPISAQQLVKDMAHSSEEMTQRIIEGFCRNRDVRNALLCFVESINPKALNQLEEIIQKME